MQGFFYKEPYEEEGRKILEMNILPGKYCVFDCIFCPVSRQLHHEKTDLVRSFGSLTEALAELDQKLDTVKPDLVFINSLGEAFLHAGLAEVIERIHERELPIRLLSNGYLYGDDRCAGLARQCEEVIGELKMGRDVAFLKAQRPLHGYTVEQHLANMVAFRKKYKGIFRLEITLVKGYSDDETSLAFFTQAVQQLHPDVLQVVTPEPPFEEKLGVAPEFLAAAQKRFQAVLAQ